MVFNFYIKTLLGICVCLYALSAPATVAAEKIDVRVLKKNGEPLAKALVLLDTDSRQEPDAISNSTEYVMDQVGMAFAPHVLVVPKGAPVSFPNSDPVGHHVYSFSKPNNFVLPLYRGTPLEPIRFNHPGVVVLGCNIHDNMLGYIVVTENQTFGWTDAEGRVTLGPRDDRIDQKIHVWSPRISSRKEQLTFSLSADLAEQTIRLQHRLKRPPNQSAKFAQY